MFKMDLLPFLFLIFLGNNFWSKKVEGLKAEKINGGFLARSGTFKYVVALLYKSPGIPDMNPCTASILGNWYVAAVAHCFFDQELGVLRNALFYIIAGTQNLQKRPSWTRVIGVHSVIIPKIYQPRKPSDYSSEGNLALVKLNMSLEIQAEDPVVSQVTLRPQEYRNLLLKYYVAGFGWQTVDIILGEVYGKSEYVQTGNADGSLTYGRGYILSDIECQSKLEGAIAPGNMCVELIRKKNNKSVGICEGDSGAPLVHKYYLDGIAIHGFMSCDEMYMPGVYLNTLHYRTFIETVLADRRNDDMYEFKLEQTPEGDYEFKLIQATGKE